jgi:hypothetical protein
MSTGKVTKAARGRAARTSTVRNDAEEALADANAEIVDTAAALGGEGESARGSLPDGLLQRRLAREKAEKEKANADKEQVLKEKELLQKQLNDMAAELKLAKTKVGDVVQVTPARKVCLDSLEHIEGVFNLLEQGILVKADESLPQRQKAVAGVRESEFTVSAMLPTTGGLMDVLTAHGQTYVRDIQKELVPRVIAVSGYRWHNSVARQEMLQILRYLTIRKGGVYAHWDALEARSPNSSNLKALGRKIAQSHAHAAGNHQALVRKAVAKLFESTPADKKLCFVKEEVFGISDGGPIIGPDHPVVQEMMDQPIGGT